MMYSEFLYLAGASEREISHHEYAVYIEPLYMDDPEELDKFKWVKKYGRGLIAALPAIRKKQAMVDYLNQTIADMCKASEESWIAYNNVLHGREEARRKVGELSDKLEAIKAILNRTE